MARFAIVFNKKTVQNCHFCTVDTKNGVLAEYQVKQNWVFADGNYYSTFN